MHITSQGIVKQDQEVLLRDVIFHIYPIATAQNRVAESRAAAGASSDETSSQENRSRETSSQEWAGHFALPDEDLNALDVLPGRDTSLTLVLKDGRSGQFRWTHIAGRGPDTIVMFEGVGPWE